MDDQNEQHGNDESFRAYRLLLMAEIRNLNTALREINAKIDELTNNELRKLWIELSYLKMKAGIWGGLGGLIPLVIAIGIAWLSSKIGNSSPQPGVKP